MWVKVTKNLIVFDVLGVFSCAIICHNCALGYLLFALGGTGILVAVCHNFLVHHTHKALLRLGMEGHCAFGQLLYAHCMVPLS